MRLGGGGIGLPELETGGLAALAPGPAAALRAACGAGGCGCGSAVIGRGSSRDMRFGGKVLPLDEIVPLDALADASACEDSGG